MQKIFQLFPLRDAFKVIGLFCIGVILVAGEDLFFIPTSGVLSVIVMGIWVRQDLPKMADHLSSIFSKIWLPASILLFALVGASMDITYIPYAGWKVVILLISVLVIRAIGMLLCLIPTNFTKKEKLFCTFTGIPKATVQAAIGGIPLALGLRNAELMLAVSVIAILITAPVGAFLIEYSYKKLLVKEHTE